MTMPFVTVHYEIFNCMHHPVIPKFDLYFIFCSTECPIKKVSIKNFYSELLKASIHSF